MRKIIIGVLFVLMISTMGIVVKAWGCDGEKTIRVYGTVEINNEVVEGADITIINLDRDYTVTATTNETGYYEAFIDAKNYDDIKVIAKYEDFENDKTFKVEKFQVNYEINFEFEKPEKIITIKQICGFFDRFKDVSIRAVMFDCLLFLLIVCLLACLHHLHKEKKDKD